MELDELDCLDEERTQIPAYTWIFIRVVPIHPRMSGVDDMTPVNSFPLSKDSPSSGLMHVDVWQGLASFGDIWSP